MATPVVIDFSGDYPEALINEHCTQLKATADQQRHLLIHYEFEQYWLTDKPRCKLCSFVQITRDTDDVCIRFTVTDQSGELKRCLSDIADNTIDFDHVCHRLSLPVFTLGQAIALSSVSIAKPWGQEIWFTGIEERGVSAASDGSAQVPLPWVLSVFPTALCSCRQRSLILLKILDPLPQPVVGDLYFELHQQKREVYVVTAVDKTAWPDGRGEIRFGIDQNKRQQYESDEAFRAAFTDAVKAYEKVRRQIDNLLDDDNDVIDTDRASRQLQAVSEVLSEQEQRLREHMESFTGRQRLQIGDVIKVPCLTPHSLQHGVRTVEFQTPVYERLIVSFAQKVLTQNHWDTEQAVALMTLEECEYADVESVLNEAGVVIDRIVDFEDFEVKRVVLQKKARWLIPSPALYSLCMGIEGVVNINTISVGPEEAVLLPPSAQGQWIINESDTVLSFLLANPK